MSKILIAGSDVEGCAAISRVLQSGHEVTVVHDGWKAFEEIYDHEPDAVLADLNVSGLTGLGVLAAAHARDPLLPVVIMSANQSLEQAVEALRLGAYDYIQPADLEVVRAALERALEARVLREENVRLVQDLRRSNEFKGHLLRTVSHDFNNLMTVIKGYARMAQMYPNKGILEDCLERIVTTVRYMESLSEDLSTYGKLDAEQIEFEANRFNLMESIQEAVGTILVDPELHHLVLPDTTPDVFADRHRTTQILSNLLGNAVKYSPDGGPIEVHARRVNGMVECCVRDCGPGIPDDSKEMLFKPFYRLERDRDRGIPGSGLGLTIVKSLVELQGGEIWVDSREGAGAHFYFTLPAAASQPMARLD